jgi:branched-chain amino acid transport system permease protein
MSRRGGLGVLAAVLVLYGLPLVLGTLELRLVIEILYLGLFAVSFNLLFGYTGLASFGHSACFGVGGYALALAATHLRGLPLVAAIPLAGVVGAAVGLGIGAFCVRLHGGYFALLTLAFSQFLYAVALKWRSVTRGDDGLTIAVPDVALPGLGTLRTAVAGDLYYVVLTVVLVCLAGVWHFTRTPLGNALLLMRENDHRAGFLGYSVFGTKLIAFAVASAVAAVAGALSAIFQRVISPAALDLPLAAEVVFMAVLGGTGAFLGPFLGAGFYLLLQNWLSKTTEHWPFVIGLIFVLMVMYAPGGLVGLGTSLVRARRPPLAEAPAA